MVFLDSRAPRDSADDNPHPDDSKSTSLPFTSPGWPFDHKTTSSESWITSTTTTEANYASTPSASHSSPTSENTGAVPAVTSNTSQPTYSPPPHAATEKGFSKQQVIAAALLPLLFVVIVGAIFGVCFRRRRRRKAQQLPVQETKPALPGKGPEDEAFVTSTVGGLIAQPAAANLPGQQRQSADQPIILAPMNSATNHAYFTGLDTSDVMSVRSTGTRATNMDEPPPPYRPRSMAMALSRDPSVRQPAPPKGESQFPRRSPFADPSDDDTVSEMSEAAGGARRRRQEDEFSAVSDLSYQNESSSSQPPAGR